ncbi:radical SAM protein [Fusobacterium gastrosuis]|uniref:radical SAM protein n=1 Tax=Fusobacterium gastrosuis TaxID=1755100 RepID=UPI002977AB7C|nr:radical SAM protein [Fusobacteriaceae bacterium]MDY5712320.1 radical SAM protein [Fusobacterium gastrosuis]
MKYKHVFGPVPSRRLGISLGVDLVVNKSCNLNCIFCECGATTEIKELRQSFKDKEEIKNEIKNILKELTPDYITFSGSGEPTLSKDLGEIILYIKNELKYNGRIALITNSVLLNDDKVIEEIQKCDLIVPTLNTLREEVFQKISRSENISIENVKKGIEKLSKSDYKGEIFLELFILENVNDDEKNLEELSDFLKNIRYDKLQINTIARMGAEKNLKAVSHEKLISIKEFLEERKVRNVEIIAKLKEREEKIDINTDLFNNMIEKRSYSDEEINKIYKK